MSVSGPAILNESLQIAELISYLNKLEIRTKVSKSTLPDTCIFPKVSFAVMILTLSHDRLGNLAEVANRVRNFIEMHGQAFVVVLVDELDHVVMNFVGEVQIRILPKTVNIAFALSYVEAVDVMMNMIKFNQPNEKKIFWEKICGTAQRGNEEDILVNALKFVGLETTDCYLALDSFGSIAGIAKASKEALEESGLSQSSISTILNFFASDSVIE